MSEHYKPQYDLTGRRIKDTFRQLVEYDTISQSFYMGDGAGVDVRIAYSDSSSKSNYAFSSSYSVSSSWSSASISASYADRAMSASWAPIDDAPYSISSSWSSASISASYAPVEPEYSKSVASSKQNALVVGGTYLITASSAVSASWAPHSETLSASWASSSISTSFADEALSASWAPHSETLSASWASQSLSASWAPVPVSASWASSSFSATTASFASRSFSATTASWASSSFSATSASFASCSLASTSASWASSSVTASYVQTASWAINVVSGGTGTTLVFTDTTAMTQSWDPSDYYVNFFDYTKSLYTPAVDGMYRLDVVAVGWITGSGNRTIYFGAKFIDEIGAYSILDDTLGYQKMDYNWTNKGLTMAGTITPNAYSGGLEPFRYYFSYLFSGKAGNAIEYYWTDGGAGLGDGANPISYSMITKASIEKLT